MEGEEGSALTLNWTLGLAKDVVGGVHNLSDSERTEMLYAAGPQSRSQSASPLRTQYTWNLRLGLQVE